jgi:hypothetical protein
MKSRRLQLLRGDTSCRSRASPEAANLGRFSFPDIGSEGPPMLESRFSFQTGKHTSGTEAKRGTHEEGQRAARIANETKCFTSYERNFMAHIS